MIKIASCKESLYCTDCGKTLHFKRKKEKNGKLIIVCDYCGHKHYRYVKDGVVMSERWGSGGDTNTKFGVEKNSK